VLKPQARPPGDRAAVSRARPQNSYFDESRYSSAVCGKFAPKFGHASLHLAFSASASDYWRVRGVPRNRQLL